MSALEPDGMTPQAPGPGRNATLEECIDRVKALAACSTNADATVMRLTHLVEHLEARVAELELALTKKDLEALVLQIELNTLKDIARGRMKQDENIDGGND